MMLLPSLAALAALAPLAVRGAYNPANLPDKTDAAHGQYGYNNCVKRYGASSQTSRCQNVFINSIKDWCLWAPDRTDTIGNREADVVAYCIKSGYGTRLIPDGTVQQAHFLKTPSFVQVTGYGDFTRINVRRGDEGGELDPHGATGAGNPVGGLVFTRAFTGNFEQIFEWNNYMSATEFSFRACKGQYAAQWCPHIYDEQGAQFSSPGNYGSGFDQCDGLEGEWPGVYSGSTWYQGVNPTPPPQPAGKSSNCRPYASISNGPAAKLPKRDEMIASPAQMYGRDVQPDFNLDM